VKVLVTGAGGFLGRHIVAALLRHGHTVRAMVRPAAKTDELGWPAEVDVYRGDLRSDRNLISAFAGVDAVIHAAAAMGLDDFSIFAGTVMSTEKFLEAMGKTSVNRLTLVSSFSCYDTTASYHTLSENSPTAEATMYERGGYPAAKLWQERLARRAAQAHGWGLTIIRPGFIWGPGHEDQACLGQKIGGNYVLFGGGRRLALTYVENCADAIVTATENARAIGQVYNVIDDDDCTAWQYARHVLDKSGVGRRIYLPYWLVKLTVSAIDGVSRLLFGGKGQLPSMFTPVKFDQRFKPFRFPNRKIREELGWKPPVSFAEAVRKTFVAPTPSPAVAGEGRGEGASTTPRPMSTRS
jgi:UDP-glucose 4-epimerase